ncbi:hypothetical protein PGT21_009314 [Puccinia graminis f. sp. tritici]|uniref:Uncharacterized protein n=1 Tax=Puccinia graminis f. sp. tritici TaxID=56615 RepID=A0A5B0RFB9_PUCGR|nr:hypothetical protein PGT21_009314 [Puccinia graminis f. sp. tritici]KAA1123673.1 hypothetical protein PGTUg99_026546 [Puccinia graminis f. sp. tritici]
MAVDVGIFEVVHGHDVLFSQMNALGWNNYRRKKKGVTNKHISNTLVPTCAHLQETARAAIPGPDREQG